jgi:hypothetical protein
MTGHGVGLSDNAKHREKDRSPEQGGEREAENNAPHRLFFVSFPDRLARIRREM